jgi:hypothetical protein
LVSIDINIFPLSKKVDVDCPFYVFSKE